MPATPFATAGDLEEALGRSLTVGAETTRANAALRYASNLVRALAPWVDSLGVVPEAVVDAVVSMALRRFTARVDGATSATVGAVSVDYGRGPLETFTVDEKMMLYRALGVTGNTTVSLVPLV